jgi:hypothetical protein
VNTRVRRPAANNVYGQLVAPGGLAPVLGAVEAALGSGCASLFRARGADYETLRIRSDACDFESLPLPGGMEHLLNGSVSGATEDVIRIVRALSAALSDARVEHSFDVHDGRRIVLSLP